jgi:hypothetical protein
MRLHEITHLLEIRHLISDGSGAAPSEISLREGPRPYLLTALDKLVND